MSISILPCTRAGLSSNRIGLVWAILCASSLGASVWAAEAGSAPDEAAPKILGTKDLMQLSLEELGQIKFITEVTVSRVEARVDESPGAVYVYTRETIQNRGYRSLGELLQTVPGFTVFHRDLQYVAGVRGLNPNDNEKITLLIDGQNLNNTHEPDFLNGPINLDNVDRVEVVVGPSAFFQQANTLAATINVITRDVNGAEIVAAAGNYLKSAATLMAGKNWASDKFASFSFTTEAKRKFDAQSNRPLDSRSQYGERNWPSFFGVLKAQYGDLSTQMTAYRALFPELNINYYPENDGTYVDQIYSLSVKDEHHWRDSLTSIVRAEATLKEISRTNDDGPPVNSIALVDKQRYYASELALQYAGLNHHFFQAGVQSNYEDNFDNWFEINSTDSPDHIPRTVMFTKDTYAIGFFFDDTYQPAEWLKIIGGIRADLNTKLPGDSWYPGARAALIALPTSDWVSKLMFNRAVRMPSAQAALNYVWGRQNIDDPRNPSWARISSPPEKPEILQTFEWQNIVYWEPVRISLSFYHEELQDFISWFFPFTNVGGFTGKGAELTLQGNLTPKLNIWANTAYNHSTLNVFVHPPLSIADVEASLPIDTTSDRLTGSPLVTANMGLNWEFLPNVALSPSVRYFTGQSGDVHATGDFEILYDLYYLDATLMWRKILGKNWDIRLSGNNLFDKRRRIPMQWSRGMYSPQGISWVLGTALHF